MNKIFIFSFKVKFLIIHILKLILQNLINNDIILGQRVGKEANNYHQEEDLDFSEIQLDQLMLQINQFRKNLNQKKKAKKDSKYLYKIKIIQNITSKYLWNLYQFFS